MADDLLDRARRAAALAPAERDRLVSELADEVGRLGAERDAALCVCVKVGAGVFGFSEEVAAAAVERSFRTWLKDDVATDRDRIVALVTWRTDPC